MFVGWTKNLSVLLTVLGLLTIITASPAAASGGDDGAPRLKVGQVSLDALGALPPARLANAAQGAARGALEQAVATLRGEQVSHAGLEAQRQRIRMVRMVMAHKASEADEERVADHAAEAGDDSDASTAGD